MSRGDIGPFPRRSSSKCINSIKFDQNRSCDSTNRNYLNIMGGSVDKRRGKSTFKFDENLNNGFKGELHEGMNFGVRKKGIHIVRSKSVSKLESNISQKSKKLKNSKINDKEFYELYAKKYGKSKKQIDPYDRRFLMYQI